MGLFDLLRGLEPGAAQQLARYPWDASRNPAPFWPLDPGSYDWSDVVAPSPNRLDAAGLPGLASLPDQPDPSFDDIQAQLMAGAASRIGPEHFALNPDNWAPPRSSASWPLSMEGFASPGLELGAAPTTPQPVAPLNVLLLQAGFDQPGFSFYDSRRPAATYN
jgi:hypothetical protein